MCGRFALYSPSERIERLLDVRREVDDIEVFRPSWNVPPTRRIPAVTASDEGRSIGLYRWGLVPFWVKDMSTFKASTFNARAETVATTNMYRSSFTTHRCLIPADAFYEWRKTGDKQPYLFQRADGEPMAFAGLWATWNHPEGEIIPSCTIITCEANGDMADVHNRMPLVLEADAWERWLDPELNDRDELEAMLRPGPEGTITHYPVARDVGSVKNDHPELLNSL